MSDPFSLLPYALAASRGSVNDTDINALIAAGLTLLQRSASLVRKMSRGNAAILLPTAPSFFTAIAACEGRAAVLVNPLAAASEIQWQLDDSAVSSIFTIEALLLRLDERSMRERTVVLLDDAPHTATVIEGGKRVRIDLGSHHGLPLIGDPDVRGSDDPSVIVYTSAMEGWARGAILTHRNLLSNARSTIAAAAILSDDHVLAMLPFSHLFGLVVSAIAPLLAGARVTTISRFNPVRAIETIQTGGATFLVGVPAIFHALVQAIERKGRNLFDHQLRVCICGGAPLSPDLQDRFWEVTGVELRQGYGLTETGPVALFNDVSRPNQRERLGTPFPDVEVSIRDKLSNQPCDNEVIGEICVRGDNVFHGYVNNASDGLRLVDGWLHSGDAGSRSADGSVTFHGLLKRMFTRNGFNIYPRELERVIENLPGVESVEVSASPDTMRENEIVVDVVGRVDEDDVRAWCELHLSDYKQPGIIRVRSGGD